MRVYLTIILLFLSSLCHADGQAAIHVTATADDSIGKQLVYQLREALRASRGMRLVDDMNDSFVRIKIVTLDPDSGRGGGYQTVYSAVWTVRQFDRDSEIYWTNYVGTCGASRTQSCATSLASQTDEVATDVRRILNEIIKSSDKK
ncbi:hypothetical protein [Methylobacillus flagellatus]|uniref:hypothetical protein n=1 Tax=Methylobacillus flagellatus TaxID=405 RepID=UPI0010F50291|nr:hypothetical protein [Methylobacillus flagellatus]